MIDFRTLRARFIDATDALSNEAWTDVERNPFMGAAPLLEEASLADCRVLPDRVTMLRRLPPGARAAEVGTQHGFFAEKIVDVARPAKLHLIDLDFSPLDLNWSRPQKARYRALREAGAIELHPGDSSTVLAAFPADHFDWIYIDAAHDYEGVRRDLAAAARCLRPGGLLICNDYTNWSVVELEPYGVMRAVNEFCVARGWTVAFLALHSLGYHDVALRKPPGAGGPPSGQAAAYRYSDLNFRIARQEFGEPPLESGGHGR